MDNIKTWTELSVEESVKMTEDRDKRRKYVHGVANPRTENRTEQIGLQFSSYMRELLIIITSELRPGAWLSPSTAVLGSPVASE